MLLVALNWYVGANVLLAVAYILLSAIGFAGGKLSRAAPYRVPRWPPKIPHLWPLQIPPLDELAMM
jgi:hypothetical protein